jgi:integrase
VKYGADIYNPESVKTVIAKQETWGNSSRILAVAGYTLFASLNKIAWQPPKYEQTRKLPFIPLESELDALIASGGKKMSATLQLLKEVPIRIGEACRLKWIDFDVEHNAITMNDPEKKGLPRMFKISARLVTMLNALPRENEYIFGRMKTKDADTYFCCLRKRVANKLSNPRMLSIHLHTFRHWNATMEYHKTKDILHVMRLLGHRNIQNTLI